MTLHTQRLDPIGVEIINFDLGEPIDNCHLGHLPALVMHEGLVLIRQPIGTQPLETLGKGLGKLALFEKDATHFHPARSVMTNVSGDGDIMSRSDFDMRMLGINEQWHSDSSFRKILASFSLLSAVVVPPHKGDTFFSSTRLAREEPGQSERELLYRLYGVHDYSAVYIDLTNESPAFIEGKSVKLHSIVRLHPEMDDRQSLHQPSCACH